MEQRTGRTTWGTEIPDTGAALMGSIWKAQRTERERRERERRNAERLEQWRLEAERMAQAIADDLRQAVERDTQRILKEGRDG